MKELQTTYRQTDQDRNFVGMDQSQETWQSAKFLKNTQESTSIYRLLVNVVKTAFGLARFRYFLFKAAL